MDAIKLTAIARPPETDQGNLFVRLTPRTARRLARIVQGCEEIPASPECCVEFLPLEITFQQRQKGENSSVDGGTVVVYASFNGGEPAPYDVCHYTMNHYGGKKFFAMNSYNSLIAMMF